MDTTAVVYWAEELQTMDGFGVCGAFRQADVLMRYPQPIREQVLDLLFSRVSGAGFSMLRNIIGDSGVWGTPLDGPSASIEPEEATFRFDGDQDQIWLMNEAKKRGCETLISSVWSPPAWMKTNGDVCNGGALLPDRYAQFADYLVRYVRGYRERHGLEIAAVSCANEPQFAPKYSSCLWTAAEMARFYAGYLGPALEKSSFPCKIFGPETEHFGADMLRVYQPIFDNSYSLPHIVALHSYNSEPERIDPTLLHGKNLWLSEISDTSDTVNDPSIADGLLWAEKVHAYLCTAGISAFIYFWGASVYYRKGISLIGLNAENLSIVVNKRLFTIGNFSRFIRPGFVRIAAEADGIRLSAYKSGRTLVLVAINGSEADVRIHLTGAGFRSPQFTAYRTSAAENLLCIGSFREGEVLPAAAGSVTTYVGCLS
jgi:glucuronoarabinoxylan endo-1,4-beta-xylanase